MEKDLTKGNETKAMLIFAIPMILGNLLQQFYNIADTFIVGKFIGSNALAAVGTSFSLMVFITSVIIGLCMGSGVLFSMYYGAKDTENLKKSFFMSFITIFFTALILNIIVFIFTDKIMVLLSIDKVIYDMTKEYLTVIFSGIMFVFIYNFFSAFLRSIGNSTIPVICLAISAILNIILDYIFVCIFNMGVFGAGFATVISQFVSALVITLYSFIKVPYTRLKKHHIKFEKNMIKRILNYSSLTSLQQSVMNFGILMIQGLVNSFGVTVTAAFAAAVKIDSFAYMPVQDFGNAFSTYIAQNMGARKKDRIHKGLKSAIKMSVIFSVIISLIVFIFAENLMLIFVKAEENIIIQTGVQYLRIEGSFYFGIGLLFILYGLYRGLGMGMMSVILTVISLGMRVLLAYTLSPIKSIGLYGIWTAIPIGWILADITGFLYYYKIKNKL